MCVIIYLQNEREVEMMYREVTGYDIKHNSELVYNIIYDNANALNNDLFCLIKGNHYDFPEDVKRVLLRLAKKINEYCT